MSLYRILSTVRHMKCGQIIDRFFFNRNMRKFKQRSAIAIKQLSAQIERSGWQLQIPSESQIPWQNYSAGFYGVNTAEKLADNTFTFLNHTESFNALDEIWGASKDLPLLWQFNLHYFDYVHELDDKKGISVAEQLIDNWLTNFSSFEPVAWHPFVVAQRLRNWVKYYIQTNTAPPDSVAASLLSQTLFLSQNLETHLLANHLLENLISLCFMHTVIKDGEWDLWYGHLLSELKEQTNTAGGHYEHSFMYHLILLEALTDLSRLCAAADKSCSELNAYIKQWVEYATEYIGRDGQFPLIGDTVDSSKGSPLPLLKYAAETVGMGLPGNRDRVFELDGQLGIQKQDWYCVLNAAEVTPAYNPGHTHSDLMSFELFWKGKPFIIDSGVLNYEKDERRLKERQTRAHNTVRVDNTEIHDVWGSFRIAARAKVCEAIADQENWLISGAYKRKGFSVRRQMQIHDDNIKINDHVKGKYSQIEVGFHIAHGFSVELGDDNCIIIKRGNDNFALQVPDEAKIAIEPCTYSRSFGEALEGTHIVLSNVPAEAEYVLTFVEGE